MDSSLSVIVCTLGNNVGSLSACLKSIRAQTISDLEIIVISRKNLPDSIRELATQTIIERRKGLSVARNVGISNSSGSIICFTDDDCTVSNNWVEKLSEPFSDPSVWLVTGGTLSSGNLWSTGVTSDLHKRTYAIDRNLIQDLKYNPFWRVGNGNNMALRRSALARVGEFDENLGAGSRNMSCEDNDMYLRMLLCGGLIVYEPSAIVHHTSFSYGEWFRRRCYTYRVGAGAVYRKYDRIEFVPRTRAIYLMESFRLSKRFAKSLARLQLRRACEDLFSVASLSLGFVSYRESFRKKSDSVKSKSASVANNETIVPIKLRPKD